jgi:RNA polymerase sigma-70 factor (ECF subfamily)
MLHISGSPSASGSTDEEILSRYLESGNLDVLGELYSRYIHLVYGVALKYLSDREAAKDATMQVFEKLIVEIPRHRVENFRSWLYVLTKNHCFMQLRTEKSQARMHEKWKTEQENMESGEEMHPLDEECENLEGALRECMNRLKDEQRRCIELFYYKKQCYKEISDQLNLPEKKVKSHLQNGKRNLRICLEEKNGTETTI